MKNWGLGNIFQLGYTTAVAWHWRSRGSKSIFYSLLCWVGKPTVVFIPDETDGILINVNSEGRVGMTKIPCEKVIGLIDVKGREGRGIMEGLDITLANNSTNRNISTLHNEIEGVGVGSFLLDCMRSRL